MNGGIHGVRVRLENERATRTNVHRPRRRAELRKGVRKGAARWGERGVDLETDTAVPAVIDGTHVVVRLVDLIASCSRTVHPPRPAHDLSGLARACSFDEDVDVLHRSGWKRLVG